MKARNWWFIGGLVLLAVVTSACSVDIARFDDGTLSVSGTMQEEALQTEIDRALADPLIQNLSVDLQPGTVLVSAERRRIQGEEVDTLTLNIGLGVSAGHLTAAISDPEINGAPVSRARVAIWNERIANRLMRAARRHPGSTLQSVTITEDGVAMSWRVEAGQTQRD
jgi:hypothetical protein